MHEYIKWIHEYIKQVNARSLINGPWCLSLESLGRATSCDCCHIKENVLVVRTRDSDKQIPESFKKVCKI